MEIKQEEVKEEAKKAKVSTVRKKAEDLPEIADYERPELEKYEESEFTPTKKEKPEKDKVVKTLQHNTIRVKTKVISKGNISLKSDALIIYYHLDIVDRTYHQSCVGNISLYFHLARAKGARNQGSRR